MKLKPTSQKLNRFLYEEADSGTGVFLWILQISKNTFFYRTPLVAASGFLYVSIQTLT